MTNRETALETIDYRFLTLMPYALCTSTCLLPSYTITIFLL